MGKGGREGEWEGWGNGRTHAFVCQLSSHVEVSQGFRARALCRQRALAQTGQGFLLAYVWTTSQAEDRPEPVCLFQDSDLKQYLDHCGNLMNMHNVKVRAWGHLPVAALCRRAQFGMLPLLLTAEVTRSLKCREEERVSLEAILSTPATNTVLPSSSVLLWT